MEKAILQLGALTCPSCMQKIEHAVANQTGVNSVKVLFNASKVKTEYDNQLTSVDTLRTAIEQLGYDVQSVKVRAL